MAGQTTHRLRLIALFGLVLGSAFLTSAVLPSCIGCGGVQWADGEPSEPVKQQMQKDAVQTIEPLVAGMSIIGVSGFLAQFAWKRYSQKKTAAAQ